ncbi:MAG: hypothetical protein F4012_00860 [Gemmatimonadales bacterium]|nr:hypothetical protein [Gemmatimonadales bacterium]
MQTWLARVSRYRLRRCRDPGELSTAYLTQAVQSDTFPVPLVAGEAALLRVFIATRRPTAEGLPPVRATFYLDGSEAYVSEIPAQTTRIPIGVNEGDLAASVNAKIPGEIIRPGLEMVVEIDPGGTLDGTVALTNRIPATGRLRLDVRDVPALDLTLIPFLWSEAPDSTLLGTVQEMSANPRDHELLSHTRTLLPVGDLRVTAHAPVLSSSNDPYRLYDQTRAIWTLEGQVGHYMGVLPPGKAPGVAGLAFPGGKVSVAILRASTIAHELGHNMSLRHAPCGSVWSSSVDPEYPQTTGRIGSWGYDLQLGDLIPPSVPDLMSYCKPVWISEYHFSKALGYRMAGQYGASTTASGAAEESLLLWGGVGVAGEPFLEPAFVVKAPPVIPQPGGGAFDLVGRTADERVLFSLSFDMPETADGEGSSAFAFLLPVESGWVGDLATIVLTTPAGTATLDADTDRPMVILRNPLSGQVRAFLRDPPPAALAGGAVDIAALSSEPDLEVLFSRGLPGPRQWRR